MDDKTFQFLGGPASEHAPLVDTTRTDIDSLLAGTGAKGTVSIEHAFTYVNTFEADLGGLDPLADSTKRDSIGAAPLRIAYTNGMPLRLDVRVDVLDDRSELAVSIPTDREAVSLEAASRADDGTASAARTGEIVLNLRPQTVRALARGEALRFHVTGVPRDSGPTARVHPTDTLRVSIGAEVTTSVRVGE